MPNITLPEHLARALSAGPPSEENKARAAPICLVIATVIETLYLDYHEIVDRVPDHDGCANLAAWRSVIRELVNAHLDREGLRDLAVWRSLILLNAITPEPERTRYFGVPTLERTQIIYEECDRLLEGMPGDEIDAGQRAAIINLAFRTEAAEMARTPRQGEVLSVIVEGLEIDAKKEARQAETRKRTRLREKHARKATRRSRK